MRKFIEKGNLFIELGNSEISTDLIIYKRENRLLWFRYGKLGKKYICFEILGKDIIDFNFK